ncbi:class I SAM-dependent methyltransferase [Haliea sp. E17]|uniref:class I SAM-dependent methyltransferase n=1 Tax=Haliea sp. E17 TaxID=3401576 RepID=UPI003AAEA1C8
MNDLERYFHNNPGKLITKWDNYWAVYERHFSRFRGRAPRVLEIGVCHGGSLQMWKHYFGPEARIYGVDIHQRSKAFEEAQIEIFIGDQEDRAFLRDLRHSIPAPDIIIDDGGHTMLQQRNTFEELYPSLAPGGLYLCEDTHSSYWPRFGGGYRRPDSFIEYMKSHIAALGAGTPPAGVLPEFCRNAASVHCYDSIVVIENHPQERAG